MKKKLQLFYAFLKGVMLINRKIINFSTTSIKSIMLQEPVDQLNNSPEYDADLEDTEIVIGAYESEFCLNFLKQVRRIMFNDFFKYNGKICIILEGEETYGLLERLSEFALAKCELHFTKEYCATSVVYTINFFGNNGLL